MKTFNYIWIGFLVLGLIFGGQVSAQGRWELVSTDKEGSTRYIDTESIIMFSPGRYLLWEKFYPVGSERQKFMGHVKGTQNLDNFAYIMARLEIDCSTMNERIHSMTYYTDDGKVIWQDIGKLSVWYDLPPGSVGETVLKRVCTKRYDAKEM